MKMFSPFKCPQNQNWSYRKIGQGQSRVIIYLNFVALHILMLHAKFQDHRTTSSGEEDKTLSFLPLYMGMAIIFVM